MPEITVLKIRFEQLLYIKLKKKRNNKSDPIK